MDIIESRLVSNKGLKTMATIRPIYVDRNGNWYFDNHTELDLEPIPNWIGIKEDGTITFTRSLPNVTWINIYTDVFIGINRDVYRYFLRAVFTELKRQLEYYEMYSAACHSNDMLPKSWFKFLSEG